MSDLRTYELKKAGLSVQCEVPLPVKYEDVEIEVGFRADMIVDNSILIENKTVEQSAQYTKPSF